MMVTGIWPRSFQFMYVGESDERLWTIRLAVKQNEQLAIAQSSDTPAQ